ncbi:uncharacterized protein [Centruroides vittatus]|uniref:uncharacterized protein n=1 Tax=Centruroides vittatus TaxID=120091 RepID=UPI00350F9474
MASDYNILKCTARKIILEVCTAIWEELKSTYMASSSSYPEWLQIANRFWEKWQFPLCLGAIDGKHIRIKAPPMSGSEFFNFKKFFSIVLMAACDADYSFTFVDVGAYGSDSDATILSLSAFGSRKLPGTNTTLPFAFVADSAFPLKVKLMRPYPGMNLPEGESIFNYRLSQARRVIESAFGILASRWHIFHQSIKAFPDAVTKMVLCTVILHNFIMKHNSVPEYCPPNFVDQENIPGDFRDELSRNWEPLQCGSRNSAQRAYSNRNALKEFFMNEGHVPWQLGIVNRGTLPNS